LNMIQLMKFIEKARDKRGISAEKFSHEVGISLTTYSRQVNGRTGIHMDSIRLYAQYAVKYKEDKMLQALGAYALNLPVGKIKIRVG
jgi:transcriptional regulator with XRE-family HTH domain